MENTYSIKLPQFEGPFDLLLFFIQRDELDIYDIPISDITSKFLDYIHQLKELNIEIASEFILTASTLMKIKAKLLLPKKPLDEEGNEIDPRKEFQEKLQQYQKYKSISEVLQSLEEKNSFSFPIGINVSELNLIGNRYENDIEMEDLTMSKLFSTFNRLLKRVVEDQNKVSHNIKKIKYSILEEKEEVFKVLGNNKKVGFLEIFDAIKEKIQMVYRFLSILELIHEGSVDIVSLDSYNSFYIINNKK